MSLRTVDLSRRRFLRGTAGASLGLPWLDVFARHARAAGPPVCAAFLINMNGVQQAAGGEPETFWPRTIGPLTKDGLAAQTDRATSVLSDHAARITMLRGMSFAFQSGGCAHTGGGNQVLTAARVTGGGNKSLALGESVDNYLARRMGVEPLALYAGPKAGYINDHISFKGPSELRISEGNPWLAYMRLVGMKPSMAASPEVAIKLASGRTSVNDLVRAEMSEVLARKDLSASDRKRLDMHFASIREIEQKITTELAPADAMRWKALDGRHKLTSTRLAVEQLHMELIAFAFAAGYTRVAFLQLGDGTDQMTYTFEGTTYPRFHPLSHRASSDSGFADGTMPMAVKQHHNIDTIIMGQLKFLLDKMAGYATPAGPLLDTSFVTWANHVATGGHAYTNVPYIIAGKAGGALKTGQYISGGSTNNKLLNALIGAAGVRKMDNTPVDDFGDASLTKGVVQGLLA